MKYFEKEVEHLDQTLNGIEKELTELKKQFVKNPSTKLANAIASEENYHKRVSTRYGKTEQALSNAERNYQNHIKEYEEAKANLAACEAEFCKKVAMLQSATHPVNFPTASHVEVGVLAGNQTSSPSGNISTATQNFSGSNSQNAFQGGLQARLFFANFALLHPFILMNALTTFNASNRLLSIKTDSFSSSNSRLNLQTLWTAHLLIGLQTAIIYNFLHISGGIGAAAINQRLQSSIAENQVTNNNTTQTSLAPSGMLGLDFDLCRACFAGHDLTLSGQIIGDKFPSINSTITTPLGNTYRNSVGSSWQFSEALVLSMRF